MKSGRAAEWPMRGSVLEQELLHAEAALRAAAPAGRTRGSAMRMRLAFLGVALALHGVLLFLAAVFGADHELPFRPEEVVLIDLRQPLPATLLSDLTENGVAAPTESDPPRKN